LDFVETFADQVMALCWIERAKVLAAMHAAAFGSRHRFSDSFYNSGMLPREIDGATAVPTTQNYFHARLKFQNGMM
jgi:hypothetical protein